MRKLKVFRTNLDGRSQVICACNSFTKFKELTGANANYTSETFNEKDVAVAMSKPFQPFIAKNQSDDWKEYNRPQSFTSWE